MKGNAFSGFHVAPVLICALSTWARFADVDSAADKNKNVVEEERDFDNNASANLKFCAGDVDLFAAAEEAKDTSDSDSTDSSSSGS